MLADSQQQCQVLQSCVDRLDHRLQQARESYKSASGKLAELRPLEELLEDKDRQLEEYARKVNMYRVRSSRDRAAANAAAAAAASTDADVADDTPSAREGVYS